jgi:hypothetical protein
MGDEESDAAGETCLSTMASIRASARHGLVVRIAERIHDAWRHTDERSGGDAMGFAVPPLRGARISRGEHGRGRGEPQTAVKPHPLVAPARRGVSGLTVAQPKPPSRDMLTNRWYAVGGLPRRDRVKSKPGLGGGL